MVVDGMRRLPRRRRANVGAALVEAAIALPLVLGLLFGIVTGGLTYSQHNAVNNAARETSRYGATLVITSESTYLDALLAEAKTAATGDLDAGVPGQSICVAYVSPTSDEGDRTMRVAETSGVVSTVTYGSPCFTDGRPTSERRVQVLLERSAEIDAIFYRRTVTLSARAVSRYERG